MSAQTLSALTLTQPWAILSLAPAIDNEQSRLLAPEGVTIGEPLKLHETRGYRLLGTPRRIAIHAGKGDGGMEFSICHGTRKYGSVAYEFVAPYDAALRAIGYSTLDPWQLQYEEKRRLFHPDSRSLALGVILGLVTVTRMVDTGTGSAAHAIDRGLGNWQPRRWGWRMEEPFMLRRPIAARGYQSGWSVTDEHQAMIREQGGTW